MNELIGTIESIPIPTIIEQPIVVFERADSGNGGSDENIRRFDRKNDEHLSPSLSALVNSDYPKSLINNDESDATTTLDYKSLLSMTTRTSTSTTTLLKQHQETLSLLDQPTTKRQPLTITNHDSILPTSHITNTTETEYPDGTRVYEFPNGQIEKHLPDGKQEHILPDKTKNIYLTDGTIISLKPNGEKFIQNANQTKEVHTDTYKRKLFPHGSILTVFNTGEQEIRYANGKIKIKDAHGNIIIGKKNPINNK
ncbi:unnamed protein product [Rotaria sordida]|uniref:Centromere protein J C-terminal domain-containing protein n=1 Tax=Rotaria sordida TaxID=392033 RepID=A0A814ZSV5_9BILA|nr:unnamed protein product [Rotaria sordida]